MKNIQFEDYPISLPTASQRKAAVIVWMPGMVAARIAAAFKTLDKLPDREAGWLNRDRVHWPEMLRDKVDVHALAIENGGFEAMRARTGPASARDVTEMEEVFEWITWIPSHAKRRVVVALSMCHDLHERSPHRRKVMAFLKHRNKGYTNRSFNRWYKAALIMICGRLNTVEK